MKAMINWLVAIVVATVSAVCEAFGSLFKTNGVMRLPVMETMEARVHLSVATPTVTYDGNTVVVETPKEPNVVQVNSTRTDHGEIMRIIVDGTKFVLTHVPDELVVNATGDKVVLKEVDVRSPEWTDEGPSTQRGMDFSINTESGNNRISVDVMSSSYAQRQVNLNGGINNVLVNASQNIIIHAAAGTNGIVNGGADHNGWNSIILDGGTNKVTEMSLFGSFVQANGGTNNIRVNNAFDWG